MIGDGFWGLWFLGGRDRHARIRPVRGGDVPDAGPVARRCALIGIGIVVILSEAVIHVDALIPIGMACFALGWFTLGVQAIRLDRPATAAGPA